MSVHRLRQRLRAPGSATLSRLVLLFGLTIIGGSSTIIPAAAQGVPGSYTMVDQWPQRDAAEAGLIRDAVGMDLAADGRSYVSDRGIAGVHVIQPDGRFGAPFGTQGDGPEALRGAGDLSVARGDQRVYVLDDSAARVVIYDLDGGFVDAWSDVDGAAIAAAEADRVYVADRSRNQVRVFDTAGLEQFSIGGPGTETGSFSGLRDLSISEDGMVLAVLDFGGLRVQLFDVEAGGLSFRRVYDLNQPRYVTQLGRRCMPLEPDKPVVNALGGDGVWVGEGIHACQIGDAQSFDFVVAESSAGGTICGPTVQLARILPQLGRFQALATFNPNPGPCVARGRAMRGKDTSQPTTPALVRYLDARLNRVDSLALAAADAYQDTGLQAPLQLGLTPAGSILVRDRSTRLRLFDLDGSLQRAFPTVSTYADGASSSKRLWLDVAAVSDGSTDAVFGYYLEEISPWYNRHGIGRFEVVEEPWRGQTVEVLEKDWGLEFGEFPLTVDPNTGIAACNTSRCGRVVNMVHHADSGMIFILYERYLRQNHFIRAAPESVEIMAVGTDGRRQRGWDLELATAGSIQFNPFVDLDLGPEGHIYLLDDMADEVVAYDWRGGELARTPVQGDVWRVAGGPEGRVYGLRLSGVVEVYEPDGSLLARFDARPFSTSDPATLSDLEVHEDGRVFVSDEQAGLVSVFQPGDAANSLPVPEGADCAFRVDKVADPLRLPLGATTRLTLALEGACGVGQLPTDIMIAVPQLYVDQPSYNGQLLAELRKLLGRIDFDIHRVGLLSYLSSSVEEHALSHDAAALDVASGKIHRARRFYPPPPPHVPQVKMGIAGAAKMLEASPGRQTVILLLQAPYCSRDIAFRPADCNDYNPAEEAAQAARDAGHRILVMQRDPTGWNAGHASVLADSDADVLETAADAAKRALGYRWPDHLATDLELVDRLPANMRLVAGSVSAPGAVIGSEVRWQLPSLDRQRTVFGLELEPLQPGRWPTNVEAVASFTDGWGQPQRLVFPIPEVEVIAPTATPIEPSPTPLPSATPSPSATPTTAPPTAVPVPVYLPSLLLDHCRPGQKRLDVALVVDTSSSMAGEKIEAARSALQSFVGIIDLAPGGDRAALVHFDTQARVLTALTDDRALVEAGIQSLETAQGTRIDLGLERAIEAMAGAGGDPRRVPMIILLSDGRQDEVDAVIEAAERAQAAGIVVYAIGLGQDVDADLLQRAAGQRQRYRFAPTPADLRAIYEGIAGEIPCW